MIDNRFPQLVKVEDATSLTDALRTKAAAFVNNVVRRVPGSRGCFNKKSGNLYFWFGEDPSAGPFVIPIAHPATDWWPLDQRDEDDSVNMLNLQLVPWEERNMEAKQVAEKKREEEAKEAMRAERRPALQHHADFLDRKRRGVQKVSAYVEPGFIARPSGLILPHDKES